MVTKVIFRIDNLKSMKREGLERPEVIAVFPDEYGGLPYNDDSCTYYSRTGQHGNGKWSVIVKNTRAAKVEEYASLYEELVSIGYDDLNIVKKYIPNKEKI